MRIVCGWFLLLSVILLCAAGEGQANENMIPRNQAERIVNDYFGMLKDGYTLGVLDLLTGPMLRNNENLLRNNPGYVNFLRERYNNSSFVIAKYMSNDIGKAAVDVVIHLKTNEEIKIRFTLVAESDRLKIYAEEELARVEGNSE